MAVKKILFDGVGIDLTQDTVSSASDIADGKTAFTNAGELVPGTLHGAIIEREDEQGGVAFYLNDGDRSETWIFNDIIPRQVSADFSVYFISYDGMAFDRMTLTNAQTLTFYSEDAVYYAYVNGVWQDESYKTVVLNEPATGDFRKWLHKNAMPFDGNHLVAMTYDGVGIDLSESTVSSPVDILDGKIGHLSNGRIVTGARTKFEYEDNLAGGQTLTIGGD